MRCYQKKIAANTLSSQSNLFTITIRSGETWTKDGKVGVVCDTPLYDWPGLDVIWDLPADVFHLIAEGITKEMLRRMFTSRQNKYSRDILAAMSSSYEAMKVFSETARRTRPIQPGNLKGNELTVITLSVLLHLVAEVMAEHEYRPTEEW